MFLSPYSMSLTFSTLLMAAITQAAFGSPFTDPVSPVLSTYEKWRDGSPETYTHSTLLGRDGSVAVHWTIVDNTTLYLGVAAAAYGWVGFGVADAGRMIGADIVVLDSSGAPTDANATATPAQHRLMDMYALANARPLEDESQDWELLSSTVAAEDDPFIAFHAKRLLNTEDSQDHPLIDDSRPHIDATPIIVAWGEEVTMSFHGANTGRGVVRFFGPPVDMANAGSDPLLSLVEEEADGSFIATAENYSIPLEETHYYEFCLNLVDIPNAPNLNDTVHLIGIDFAPSIDVNGVDTSNHVHHFAAFGAPVVCEDPARFPQFFYGWGPGQPPLLFPEEVGIPIGNEGGGFVSVNLQIHYDNLAKVPDLIDSTGIRLYYTSTLREHSAGVLFVGDPYTNLSPASVGVGPTQHVLTCPGSCTAFEFAEDHDPITVFTEAFHMHETGVRAVNQQMRNGTVVRESSVDFFDFWAGGIQHARQEPFELQAGDAFRTSCYYNTAKKGVLFGDGTRDEMCVAFLWYYPAISQTGLGFCGPGFGAFSGGACEGAYESVVATDDFDRAFGRVVDENSSKAPATTVLVGLFAICLVSVLVSLS